jgi:NTP pyrophosphatase (non-canonical NTP hydrolase)
MYLSQCDLELLKKAQETYGNKNQIVVSIEECCELAAILSKYVRYPDHDTAKKDLYEKVLSEVADIIICLNHIIMIFDIDKSNDIDKVISHKLERLKLWLSKSDNIYQTVLERG